MTFAIPTPMNLFKKAVSFRMKLHSKASLYFKIVLSAFEIFPTLIQRLDLQAKYCFE